MPMTTTTSAAATPSLYPCPPVYFEPVSATTMFYHPHNHLAPPGVHPSPTPYTPVPFHVQGTNPHNHPIVPAYPQSQVNVHGNAQAPGPLNGNPYLSAHPPGAAHHIATASQAQSTLPATFPIYASPQPPQIQSQTKANVNISQLQTLNHSQPHVMSRQNHQPSHQQQVAPVHHDSTVIQSHSTHSHPYYMSDHSAMTAMALQQMQFAQQLHMQQAQHILHAQLSTPLQQQEAQNEVQNESTGTHSQVQLVPVHIQPKQSLVRGSVQQSQIQQAIANADSHATIESPHKSSPRVLSRPEESQLAKSPTRQPAMCNSNPNQIYNGQVTHDSNVDCPLHSEHVYDVQTPTLKSEPVQGTRGDVSAMYNGICCRPVSNSPSFPNTQMETAYRIGRYTPAERRVRLERYREKRATRNYNRRVKYDCRKMIADKRIRVQGRFVKRDEEVALAVASSHHYDNEHNDEGDSNLNDRSPNPRDVCSSSDVQLSRNSKQDGDDDGQSIHSTPEASSLESGRNNAAQEDSSECGPG